MSDVGTLLDAIDRELLTWKKLRAGYAALEEVIGSDKPEMLLEFVVPFEGHPARICVDMAEVAKQNPGAVSNYLAPILDKLGKDFYACTEKLANLYTEVATTASSQPSS